MFYTALYGCMLLFHCAGVCNVKYIVQNIWCNMHCATEIVAALFNFNLLFIIFFKNLSIFWSHSIKCLFHCIKFI